MVNAGDLRTKGRLTQLVDGCISVHTGVMGNGVKYVQVIRPSNENNIDNILSNDIKSRIKGLAYYQIAGGVIGIGLTIWLIAQTAIVTGLAILIFILAAGLYTFSIYCGQQLLKGETKTGLKLSVFNQALQTINFAVLGFAFKFVAGLLFSIGIDYTNDFKFNFNFSLCEFQFNINSDKEMATIGINIIAIYLVYYINKLQQEIENKESILKASQNIATPADNLTIEENT